MDISVIMPAYNTELYISQAIDSVLEQKGVRIELIVINDGSTDKTLNIILEKQKKYDNLILINEENKGLSYARKEGLKISTGKYVYFVDSDDFLTKGSLKYMYDACEQDNLDCLMINAIFKSEINNDFANMMANKCVVSKNYPNSIISGEKMLELMIKNREWRYAVWLYFAKKSLLDKVDFFENIIHEDSGYNYQLLNNVKKMKFVNKPLYNYRIRKNSIMSKKISLDNVKGYINSYKVIYEANNKKSFRYQNLLFEMRILDQIIECIEKLDNKCKDEAYELSEELEPYIKKRNNYYIDKYRDFFGISSSRKLDDYKIKYLEIDIVDHCNLNCENCSHFSQLATPAFMSTNTFKKDIERLSKICNGSLGRLILMGGEPLLNKEICEFFKIARKNFCKTEIQILSNGILINKMPEEFWKSCKEYDIQINITPYPIGLDYYEIYNKVLSYGLKLFIYDNGTIYNKHFDKYEFDENGIQNIDDNYTNCFMAKNCANLKNGNIYLCPIITNIDRYNSYYGKHLNVSNDDYINIHNSCDISKIRDYLSKPAPFCRYCNLKKINKTLWRRFKK